MKPVHPEDNNLKALHNLWPCLRFWQRKALLIHAYWLIIPRVKSPVVFALRATFAIFALLIILPLHPMAIPTAAGGGLAFALLTH